jgi:capsular polysaccharide biosynthesis protein
MSTQAKEQNDDRLFDLPPSPDGHGRNNDHPLRSQSSLGAAMRRHWRFVLAPIVGLLTLALLVGLVRTPTYTAKTRLAVGGLNATNPASLTGFADAAQQLAQTYSRSVQGDGVVGDVARRMNATPEQVRSHLSAAPIPETPVFSLAATSGSADGAIQLSTLASQALVGEVDRASQADPARLLDEYRRAELEREQVSSRVDALAATGGTALAAAQAELAASEAHATALRDAYGVSQQSGTVPLQIIQRADQADSDRLSVLQLRTFVAVVLGLILGMALALFRDSPFYEGTIAALVSLRGRWPFKAFKKPVGAPEEQTGTRSRRRGEAGKGQRSSRRART